QLPADRFQQFFRMGVESFLHVHELIYQDPVFYNESRNPQVSSSKQLAVCLKRLASESSTAGGTINVGQVFGIDEGTVTLYTRHFLKALMNLWGTVVKWGSIKDRAAMKGRLLKDASGHGWGLFRDCVGIVDGMLIPFKGRPFSAERSVDYWNFRKAKYGLYFTVICDDRRKILICHGQYSGAVHDARAVGNQLMRSIRSGLI
ncbi:hypothetical protein EV426DRAFT_528251, partial [Tirmania nivea]